MLKRADKKQVTKDVKLSKLLSPKNLTLTGNPANEVAFKIVRKDEKSGEPVAKIARQRPVRRMAPSLTLMFPETVDDESIAAFMTDFGIAEYKMGEVVDGKRVVKASDDATLPETYVTINLRDGVQALIAQGGAVPTDTDPKPNIAVVEISFKKEHFASDEDVRVWAAGRGIDISDCEIDNGGESAETLTVRRSKVEEGAEVKRVPIVDGVEAVITRAEQQDIPPNLIEVVSETAYGQWGWGQLDFSAYMADVEFSEVSRRALEVLDSVIREILFWSHLPLAVRKELVARASAQFAAFIGALLDALPARAVMTYRSDKEKDDMSKKDSKTLSAAERVIAERETKRAEIKKRADAEREFLKDKVEKPDTLAAMADEDVIAVADEVRKRSEEEAAEAAKKAPVTRSEVQELIGSAVTDAVSKGITAALEAAGVKRNDTPEAKAAEEKAQREQEERKRSEESAKLIATTVAEAVRSAMEPVTKTVSELGGKVEILASQTTMRSDGTDGKQSADKSGGDVFAGMFRRKDSKSAASN